MTKIEINLEEFERLLNLRVINTTGIISQTVSPICTVDEDNDSEAIYLNNRLIATREQEMFYRVEDE